MQRRCIQLVSESRGYFRAKTGLVGADQERDMTSAVMSVLGRLPGAQLFVLDAIVKHLKE